MIIKSIPFIYYIVQLQVSFLLSLNKTKSTAFLSYSGTASATVSVTCSIKIKKIDPKQHQFCSGHSSVFRNAQ